MAYGLEDSKKKKKSPPSSAQNVDPLNTKFAQGDHLQADKAPKTRPAGMNDAQFNEWKQRDQDV